MSFVPVYLGFSYLTITKSHESNPFQFAPASRPVLLAKTFKVSNRSSYGNRLNLINFSDDFKVSHIVSAEELLRCLERVYKRIDVLFGVIDIEAGAGGVVHPQSSHQRLRTMMPAAHRDPRFV